MLFKILKLFIQFSTHAYFIYEFFYFHYGQDQFDFWFELHRQHVNVSQWIGGEFVLDHGKCFQKLFF